MNNSSFRNYKEKILQSKSNEVQESALKEFFEQEGTEEEEETEMEYSEDDTLDEFVKEFDVEKLIRFISSFWVYFWNFKFSSACENDGSDNDDDSFECLNRYLVMNEDEGISDEISVIS